MKTILLILAAASAASAYKSCTPGTYFKTECNTCVCAQDGSASICTKKACPPGFFNADGSLKVPLDVIQQIIPDVSEIEIVPGQVIGETQVSYVQVCTPNSFFHIGCNECRCTALGDTYSCVKKACPPVQPVHVPNYPYHHHRAARSAQEKTCEPGTKYYDYCNTCICSKDGKPNACTDMACDEEVFNKDGSLKYPYSDLITPIF